VVASKIRLAIKLFRAANFRAWKEFRTFILGFGVLSPVVLIKVVATTEVFVAYITPWFRFYIL
jgi:hypothetical protein